jgi:hypothetical protein
MACMKISGVVSPKQTFSIMSILSIIQHFIKQGWMDGWMDRKI